MRKSKEMSKTECSSAATSGHDGNQDDVSRGGKRRP